jgi:hypothetical protein
MPDHLSPKDRATAINNAVQGLAQAMAEFDFADQRQDRARHAAVAAEYLARAAELMCAIRVPEIAGAHLFYKLGPPPLPTIADYEGLTDEGKLGFDASRNLHTMRKARVLSTDLIVPGLGGSATPAAEPFEALAHDIAGWEEGAAAGTFREVTASDQRRRTLAERIVQDRAVLMALFLCGKTGKPIAEQLNDVFPAPSKAAFNGWAGRIPIEIRERMELAGEMEAKDTGLPSDQCDMLTHNERVIVMRKDYAEFKDLPDHEILAKLFAAVMRRGVPGLLHRENVQRQRASREKRRRNNPKHGRANRKC